MEKDMEQDKPTEQVTIEGQTGKQQPAPIAQPRTYTQDEYDRYGQSQASKGKNDILKSMGVNSIQEVLDMRARLDQASSDIEQKSQQIAQLTEEKAKAESESALAKLGVADDHYQDVQILAKAKMAEGETFAQAAERVIKDNPQWRKRPGQAGAQAPNPGSQPKPSATTDSLKKKYPWLKD